MPFYRLEPGLHEVFGITKDPEIPKTVNFKAGAVIEDSLDSPLEFEVDFPAGMAPGNFLALQIPVVSDLFVATLRAAGVDDFQLFPAVLRNPETSERWSGYQAFNTIGVLDAVDMDASVFDEIMPGSGSVPPLLDFEKLVIDESKAGDRLMFRLLQNRTLLVIQGRVRDRLKDTAPEGGWRVTTFELEAR